MKKILLIVLSLAIALMIFSCKKNNPAQPAAPQNTAVPTLTHTVSPVNTPTITGTATLTSTITRTHTITKTITVTSTITQTSTITPTFTATLNATPMVFQYSASYTGSTVTQISTCCYYGFTTGTLFAIGANGGHNYRILMRFDLTALSGKTIDGADLDIFYNYVQGSNTIKAYKLTSSYIYGQASWTTRTATVNWTTPGGDYDATAISDGAVPSGAYGTFRLHLDKNTVQSWVNTPAGNYGFLLRGTDEASAGHYYYVNTGTNGITEANRPKLTVYYR